MVIKRSELFY